MTCSGGFFNRYACNFLPQTNCKFWTGIDYQTQLLSAIKYDLNGDKFIVKPIPLYVVLAWKQRFKNPRRFVPSMHLDPM